MSEDWYNVVEVSGEDGIHHLQRREVTAVIYQVTDGCIIVCDFTANADKFMRLLSATKYGRIQSYPALKVEMSLEELRERLKETGEIRFID